MEFFYRSLFVTCIFFIGVCHSSEVSFHDEMIHIEISESIEFERENFVFEELTDIQDTYTFPPLVEKSLTQEKDYFLRWKTNSQSEWSSPELIQFTTKSYEKPSHIQEEIWETVTPYLLPEDHPIRPALDQLFSESRAILSVKSMRKAGFIDPNPRKWTHVIVTRHPGFPGYIFKVYLDAQRHFKGITEWEHWIRRINGVMAIQTEIEKRNLENQFKTPKKWIYDLPGEPSPPKEFKRKNFILVEEDMDIYDTQENYDLWKSDLITTEKLFAFYTLCEELGLHDCAKPDNAPFSKDGRIAFIDTETFYRWPVLYKKMTPYLSPERLQEWKAWTK